MSLPILYSFRRCPYAMRARLALAASGETVELREVDLKDKPIEMLQASPKGSVPVLIHADGSVLEESLDIMLWALRQHDPAQWLKPETGGLDEMLGLIARCDGDFKHNLDRYKYPERHPGLDPMTHRAAATGFLTLLDACLTKHPHLFGKHPALADIAVLPFVRQFFKTDEDWFRQQSWHALQAWLESHLHSSAFVRIMAKYKKWTPDSAPVYFPES